MGGGFVLHHQAVTRPGIAQRFDDLRLRNRLIRPCEQNDGVFSLWIDVDDGMARRHRPRQNVTGIDAVSLQRLQRPSSTRPDSADMMHPRARPRRCDRLVRPFSAKTKGIIRRGQRLSGLGKMRDAIDVIQIDRPKRIDRHGLPDLGGCKHRHVQDVIDG